MAFISSGYDPKEPMKNRITDIGPRKYDEFYPPVIAKNKGTWLYHQYLKPGVYYHVAESGDKVYTVRVGGARLMSTLLIQEICATACGQHLVTVTAERKCDSSANTSAGTGNQCVAAITHKRWKNSSRSSSGP
jgi:hypothetical protein